jgi:adenylyltransferase/sulfurtransferase
MLVKKYIVLIAVILLVISLNAGDKMLNEYKDVSPLDAKLLLEENPELIIIDVSPIWHKGHLPGAVNFPWGDGSFEKAVPDWDKEAMYLIYCHGDAPAIAAAEHLVENGFKHVYRLEGNYGAWVDAGYKIEK